MGGGRVRGQGQLKPARGTRRPTLADFPALGAALELFLGLTFRGAHEPLIELMGYRGRTQTLLLRRGSRPVATTPSSPQSACGGRLRKSLIFSERRLIN